MGQPRLTAAELNARIEASAKAGRRRKPLGQLQRLVLDLLQTRAYTASELYDRVEAFKSFHLITALAGLAARGLITRAGDTWSAT